MKSNSKNKIIKTALGLIIGICLTIFIQQRFFSFSLDKMLTKTANEINKNCPMIIDQETRLDNSVALPNKTLQYNYTLTNIEKDSIDIPTFISVMEPTLLNHIKTDPDLKIFRDQKITIVHNYNDKDGVFITKISIDPDKYKE